MRISSVTGDSGGQPCADCSIRPFGICAALDQSDLRELEHQGRHIHFTACETVFAQEEITTSFYNLLEGVMRLYKLLPDGRRQIVGFELPAEQAADRSGHSHWLPSVSRRQRWVSRLLWKPVPRLFRDRLPVRAVRTHVPHIFFEMPRKKPRRGPNCGANTPMPLPSLIS